MARLHIALVLIAAACTATAAATEDKSSRPKRVIKNAQQRNLITYFNMRLYWKQGYQWQESSSEKKWCMKCRSNRCSKGTGIKVARCNRDDWRQNFFFDDGRIRSRRNKDVCLERQGRSIVLDNCNSSQDQVWATLRKDEPFQLRIPGNMDKCVSQHHHPRQDEKIYMTSCKRSTQSQTDKWVVY